MQNRMDKYSVNPDSIGSRTERNKELYETVKNSSMKNYEIKSNISVIDDDVDNINVGKVRKILDERYNEEAPKRKSIKIPEFEEPIQEEPIQDTKEYDINAILAKAKQGKNVDYNKERLKKIRETQFDILNNLDLELKKVEEPSKTKEKELAENNLMNLINTITELEIKNQKNNSKTELDLLSDLTDDSDDAELTEPNRIQDEEELEESEEQDYEDDDEEDDDEVEEAEEEEYTTEIRLVKIGEKKNSKKENEEISSSNENNVFDSEKKDEPSKIDTHSEQTLSKLNINLSSYDDFADISKRDNGSLIIKIIIFIVIIILVVGAVYILNDMLELGLF